MNSHALELLLFAIAPLRGLLAHNAIDIDDDDDDDDDDEKTKSNSRYSLVHIGPTAKYFKSMLECHQCLSVSFSSQRC